MDDSIKHAVERGTQKSGVPLKVQDAATINAQELAVLGDGAQVKLGGRAPRTRAILVAGRPLREPVARYGPFVMNTREELQQAFADYQAGKF